MPDLGNLSLSAALTLTRCPNIKPVIDPTDITSSLLCDDSVKSLPTASIWGQGFQCSFPNDDEVGRGCGSRVSSQSGDALDRSKRHYGGKNLEDHVKSWVRRKQESGVPESRCSFPFLEGARKMVEKECLCCRRYIFPGEEVECSIRGCGGVYHAICAKESLGFSGHRKFKCPQHECFICKQRLHWKCIRCTIASHDKCAPWPDKVMHLNNQPGKAICWRHPTDWRVDLKHAVTTNDIEEVFCRLPLPYVDEEFKIDITWKDMEKKMEPPPYTHIRRNIYLVKKKRDSGVADGIGCTNCKSECSDDCVCRVQCISCSKACHCRDTCTNRPFRKEKKIKIVKTEYCGWGVEAAESIGKGEFVIEYIGEVIDDALCEQRLWDMKYKGMKNFYMCEIRKDFTIDATFKGNASRFLNHSCDPNCSLEKWQVEGETRVGVFAARSIEVGEPLTYDYRFVQFGPEVKCHCGASNCQRFLGSKKRITAMDLFWGTKRRRTSAARITDSISLPLHLILPPVLLTLHLQLIPSSKVHKLQSDIPSIQGCGGADGGVRGGGRVGVSFHREWR
ncbi:histone-lysine N-methyltransferase ASHR3-like isoform X2 [Cucurbita maxima]|uniref:Histone-lysine N-methyltransferase ASHR3-like isoform X2 n=1 Tax=Cucurbita maxima TaxID=3661 RepID=A0A6J1JDD2_CUCMA|nr:histone-lysine N-methyltransferase ASHR3-like isoform X2 [Cucurbita maxima]